MCVFVCLSLSLLSCKLALSVKCVSVCRDVQRNFREAGADISRRPFGGQFSWMQPSVMVWKGPGDICIFYHSKKMHSWTLFTDWSGRGSSPLWCQIVNVCTCLPASVAQLKKDDWLKRIEILWASPPSGGRNYLWELRLLWAKSMNAFLRIPEKNNNLTLCYSCGWGWMRIYKLDNIFF